MIYYLFIFFCCFPYIKWFGIGTSTDLQIYAFAIAVVVIVFYILKNRGAIKIGRLPFLFFLSCVLLAVTIIIVSTIKQDEFTWYSMFRRYFGYVSNVIIPLAGMFAFKSITKEVSEKLLKYFYWIWILISLIQLINPNFFVGWLDRVTNGGGRGSISLASEPAYFALHILLINILLLLIEPQKNKKLIYITVLVIAFVARNMTALVYAFFFLMLFDHQYKNDIKKIVSNRIFLFASLAALIIGLLIFVQINTSSRLSFLILNIMEYAKTPQKLITFDGSFNIRFTDLFFTIKGIFEKLFIPQGVTELNYYFYEQYLKFPEMFFRVMAKPDNNTASVASISIFGIIFEGGIFAIPFFWYMRKMIKTITKNNKLFIFILIIGLNSLNLTNPILLLLFGFLMFKSSSTEDYKIKENKI